jgi:hypothetical protein
MTETCTRFSQLPGWERQHDCGFELKVCCGMAPMAHAAGR